MRLGKTGRDDSVTTGALAAMGDAETSEADGAEGTEDMPGDSLIKDWLELLVGRTDVLVSLSEGDKTRAEWRINSTK